MTTALVRGELSDAWAWSDGPAPAAAAAADHQAKGADTNHMDGVVIQEAEKAAITDEAAMKD